MFRSVKGENVTTGLLGRSGQEGDGSIGLARGHGSGSYGNGTIVISMDRIGQGYGAIVFYGARTYDRRFWPGDLIDGR